MKDRVKSMRTYLSMAKGEWEQRLEDDVHVDSACNCLMFSIELGIKHLISLDGVNPPHKHEMKLLLAALPEKYYNSTWYSLLSKWQNETNTWYNDSRHSDDFTAVSTVVEDYINAAELLLLDADSKVSYVCTIETKVQKVLNKLNSNRSVSDIIKYLPDVDLPEDVLYGLIIDILQNK